MYLDFFKSKRVETSTMAVQFLRKYGFIIFGGISIADLLLIIADLQIYRYATKPLLLPILLASVFAVVGLKRNRILKILLASALIAGTCGDILLIQSEREVTVFAFGIACFLLMQVLYFTYFLLVQPFNKNSAIGHIILATALYVCCFFSIRFLSPAMGELRVPVIIYAAVISAMFISAVNLYYSEKFFKLAIKYFIPGAGLLVISDAMLAFNKFYFTDQLFDVAVMTTYLVGQFLLALGFTKHLRPRRHKVARPDTRPSGTAMQLE